MKTYNKGKIVKTVVYVKNGHIDQWNLINIVKIEPHTYSQLIFGKNSKVIKWSDDNLFN